MEKSIFKNTYLHLSLKVSVAVQVISAVIQFFPMFMSVPPAYMILKQLLFLENIVQVIQGSFYAWLVYNIKNETNITPKRYIDWAITTPIMLISLICYMIFLRGSGESHVDIVTILHGNYATIFTIVILNALMLLFGYLGEINVIPVIWGILIGFIPFVIYFYIIYDKFVKSDTETHIKTITDTTTNVNTEQSNINTTILKLFLYFLFFWSLYGIVGLLPYYIKNTIYNILDLFSKNFFGLLLSYLIVSKSINRD
jgi:bacteriorhodopsin